MSKEKRFVIQVDPLEIEDDAIYDNKELRLYECQSGMMSDICSLLNQQDQRIAELEEQLKNATHKFSIGEEVYYLGYNYKFEPYVSKYLTVCKGKILDVILREGGYVEYNFTFDGLKWIAEENCFLTKKEAEAKLRELTAKNV